MKKRKLHKEVLWALVNKQEGTIAYLLAPTAATVWAAIIDREWMGTGHTRATLYARGWRAKRVQVQELKS